jgi:hypothetical protein
LLVDNVGDEAPRLFQIYDEGNFRPTQGGCHCQVADLAGKRLEILREVLPGLRRVGVMANAGNPLSVGELGEVQGAARTAP